LRVAELFTVAFEVEGDVPVEVVAGIFAGLGVVAQEALDLAARAAEVAVDEGLGPASGTSEDEAAGRMPRYRAFIRGKRMRETRPTETEVAALTGAGLTEEALQAAVGIDDLRRRTGALADVAATLAMAGDPVRSAQVARQAEAVAESITDQSVKAEALADVAGALAEAGQTEEALEVAAAIGDQPPRASTMTAKRAQAEGGRMAGIPLEVRARGIAGLLPRRPYRFRSVRYGSPLVVEIISDAGFAAMALTFVLRLVRDWSSARRRSAAAAQDAESQAFFRIELRRLMLEQLAEGGLALPPGAVEALVSGSMPDAVDRLAAYGPSVEQQAISGG
jgi:hypothetical protein